MKFQFSHAGNFYLSIVRVISFSFVRIISLSFVSFLLFSYFFVTVGKIIEEDVIYILDNILVASEKRKINLLVFPNGGRTQLNVVVVINRKKTCRMYLMEDERKWFVVIFSWLECYNDNKQIQLKSIRKKG